MRRNCGEKQEKANPSGSRRGAVEKANLMASRSRGVAPHLSCSAAERRGLASHHNLEGALAFSHPTREHTMYVSAPWPRSFKTLPRPIFATSRLAIHCWPMDDPSRNGSSSPRDPQSNAMRSRRTRTRTSIACDTCRSRRTRCDSARPACSYCRSHAIDCQYQNAPPPAPSR
jgi:hypothetical protein